MRGALELDGVEDVAVEVGRRDFHVTFDPERVSTAAMLAALEEAGEGSELRE